MKKLRLCDLPELPTDYDATKVGVFAGFSETEKVSKTRTNEWTLVIYMDNPYKLLTATYYGYGG